MPNATTERPQTFVAEPTLKERFSREVPEDIKNLPISELVRYIDTEPVRLFLLTKYSAESKRIADALKTKKISARTNADLEGYRSYVANFKILRGQILEIANAGVCTSETREKLLSVANRVELHHTRVATDIEAKYPDLFKTTSKAESTVAPEKTITEKGVAAQEKIDVKRDALLHGKNTPPEEKKTSTEKVDGVPETIGEAYKTLQALRDKMLVAQAKGNPAALVTNAQYQEFTALLARTEKSITGSKGNGMYGERIDPDLADTLPETFAKLSKLTDDIVSFLEAKPVAPEPTLTPAPAAAVTPPSPEPPKIVTLDADTEKLLAQSKAFREQFRGTKDLEKGKDESGQWYVKEKAKLGEELGKFYTKDLGTRVGARIRGAFGMKAAELSPELKRQRSAAETAAQAYSSSLEQRYYARLGRELAAGRMTKETFDKRQLQFSSMMANRFVFQSVDMIHNAEKAALSESQKSTLGKAAKWFGNISKGARIAIAAGGILSGAAILPGAFKIIWTATGAGAVIGKMTNDAVVRGAKENVRSTIMDIGQDFRANNLAGEKELYEQSLRALDRRKTIGVAAAMAVGAGVAGGGTALAEHLSDSLSGADAHLQHLDAVQHTSPDARHDAIPQHTSPDAHHDASPENNSLETRHDAPSQSISPEVHQSEVLPTAKPEVPLHTQHHAPHIELAPNAGHLYHPVAANETLWGHSESFFDKELRSHFIAGHDRDLVLENLRERLIAHPELTKEIGIQSGHPDHIEYNHVAGITGEVVKGDTLDDTLLSKLVNEEIAKLTAKIGTPMEQATGVHHHVLGAAPVAPAVHTEHPPVPGKTGDTPDASVLDAAPLPHAVTGVHDASPGAVKPEVVPRAPESGNQMPPVPGETGPTPSHADTLDQTHAQPIPEPLKPGVPQGNTPILESSTKIDIPTAAIPNPLANNSDMAIAAAAGTLGAGALSALENKRVVGHTPEPREIQDRKADLIRRIEKQKSASRVGGIFGSFFSDDATPQSPYEALKNMSVTTIAETYASKPNETESVKAAREVRKASFVRQHRISSDVLDHWMDNFGLWKSIIVGSDKKLADTMTFDTLLERISEYQLERGETLKG